MEDGPLNGPHDCQNFSLPTQFPQGTVLLAVNKGAYQETQTVWELPKTEQMLICDNDESFWSGNTEGTNNCEPLTPPEGVDQNAKLASLNSGTNQEAQSFWVNPDNSITECTHEKQSTGFLGLTAKFGAVKSCKKFQTPTDKFPKAVEQPTLAGVTSDDIKPGETFWQDKKGVVVRCENQRVLDHKFMGTSHIGPTTSCDFWPVNNLPD